MRLAEIQLRKQYVDRGVEELQRFLIKIVQNGNISQRELSKLRAELDSYMDDSQKYSIQIESATTQVDVNIGGTTVLLKDALKIRDTLVKKINNITDLIDNSNGSLDITSFITQRDQLYEEYLTMNGAISMAEWSADLD